ncbi:cation:proton antiporter [Xylocopilactobacillus apis]|uniref:Na+/H+ antiporter n=1 Tax=Xylocopilactobacillus apis TaxID=2932183 RepID=A0AAU9DG22_9LACO|nr:sodium:proton antiporter [Xylocopilactobacillus apis]BDR55662.1 Na+/H+ antiporter [Xylocopilactobacillus apis]
MELIISILLMLAATVGANIIYSFFPKIPLAFYQIGMGFIVSWLPQFDQFQLKPEVFFLAIIAPLMFNEGQNTSNFSLKNHLKTILSLAVFLTVVTILVVGVFLHQIWPALPLALAFCLGAIVTPTDAVAVSSITENFHIPKTMLETLENESLFNDAAGIVALDLAINAFNTGKFSLIEGISNFLVVFFGGIIVGLLTGILLVIIQLFFQQHFFNSTTTILSINLLAPFSIYLIAEEFNFSGILAVVAAGIIHGIYKKRLRLTSTENQVALSTMWEIISQLLNGFVFVLLGVTLPRNMIELSNSNSWNSEALLFLALSIYCLMIILRFLWNHYGLVKKTKRKTKKQLRNSWIMALSGIHGTITLAMAFSLPLIFKKDLFPFRTNLIFLAEAIIVISLITPTIVLPHLLPQKKRFFTIRQFNKLLTNMIDYAIQQLKEEKEVDYLTMGQVIATLHTQRGRNSYGDSKRISQLFQKTLNLEIKTVNSCSNKGLINSENAKYYNFKLMLNSRKMILNPWSRIKIDWKILKNIFLNSKIYLEVKNHQTSYLEDFKVMEKIGFRAIINYLKKSRGDRQKDIHILHHYYEIRHQRINQPQKNSNIRELLISAFQYEYLYLQQAAKNKENPRELIQALSEKISTDQFVYITSDN